ncbi:MAG: GNAT family N-acetyltransferase [Bacteroidota bacterium]
MIRRLSHTQLEMAQEIYRVFQVSYAVEAELLGAVDNFPPLQRKPSDFLTSDTDFFGYFEDNVLAAVMEIRTHPSSTHIQSLVVDPAYFRRGIGKQLVTFVFDRYTTEMFHVETGTDNGPARALYVSMGFELIKEWKTKIGIRKVRFEKRA